MSVDIAWFLDYGHIVAGILYRQTVSYALSQVDNVSIFRMKLNNL